GPSLVLLHHMDVVPVEGQTWRYPPFEGRVADGAIWGRGAVDTKGSAIVMMAAMRALAASGIKPKYPIHYLAVPDEETQGPAGAGWFVDNALER
ncbi:MAG: M20/M25/M40 family metallo-hydrolase, partial [Burkholderiales bacterium]|nr:M20/M25/M40 family metallo-hydrolase [Burkholderiales bacterium]